ncbi:hypothetical protein LOTGIDRAFT_166706 [Lottia gigantea]|uniref:Uncharacterized protein n=1 Tax=Lottia gigantea TaxID=225164 RepID=V4A110_LOTGI|nr:hypothetical protein LOTGIDRAFT_166706 [Lottia gigantea]ESO86971.1 hypothetical protein LOTGIDRAFT_166706 [Lottia gigantea]
MADSIEEKLFEAKARLFQMPFDTMVQTLTLLKIDIDKSVKTRSQAVKAFDVVWSNSDELEENYEDCTNPPFDRRLDEVPPETADGVADQDGRSGGNLSQEEDERPNGDSSQEDERSNGDSFQEELHSGRKRLRKAPSRLT